MTFSRTRRASMHGAPSAEPCMRSVIIDASATVMERRTRSKSADELATARAGFAASPWPDDAAAASPRPMPRRRRGDRDPLAASFETENRFSDRAAAERREPGRTPLSPKAAAFVVAGFALGLLAVPTFLLFLVDAPQAATVVERAPAAPFVARPS